MTFSGFPPSAPRLYEDPATETPSRRPRGVPADHPRPELLRHRRLDAGRRLGPGPALGPARAAAFVRETWEPVRPLLDRAAARGITPQPRDRGADPTP